MKTRGPLFVLLLLLLCSCGSPLDPVTPRLRVEDPEPRSPHIPVKIPGVISMLVLQDSLSNLLWKAVITDSVVQVDTTIWPPLVWLRLKIARLDPVTTIMAPMVKGVWLNLESYVADSRVYDLTSVLEPTRAQFVIGTMLDEAKNITYDTLLGVPQKVQSYITFSKDSLSQQILGTFRATIPGYSLQFVADLRIRF
jgi:hypothetical protein